MLGVVGQECCARLHAAQGNLPFVISFADICTWIGQQLETALWKNITWSEMRRQNCISTNYREPQVQGSSDLEHLSDGCCSSKGIFHGSGTREKELLGKTPTMGIQNFYGITYW